MKGRPIRGLIGGLILGILVDVDLAFSGVVKLESVVLTILPIALLVVGLLLGLWAPIGRSNAPSTGRTTPLPPSAPEAFAAASMPPAPAAADTAPGQAAPPPAPEPGPAAEDTPPI